MTDATQKSVSPLRAASLSDEEWRLVILALANETKRLTELSRRQGRAIKLRAELLDRTKDNLIQQVGYRRLS